MVITPNTNIRLLKLPVELSNQNQLTFQNATEQYNYFHNIENHLDLDDATYMRKDGTLRFNKTFDEVLQYNYCMYQNESYSNKWFYAYVNHIEWLSNGSCSINLKTDVWQTYQFNIELLTSFIEREHIAKNDDIIGNNIVDENLQVGEYISIYEGSQPTELDACDIVLGTTASPIDGSDCASICGGIPSGLGYFTYGMDASEIEIMRENLQYLTDSGKSSGIVSLFIAPQFLTGGNTQHVSVKNAQINNTYAPQTFTFNIPNIISLYDGGIGEDGTFIPKNKKLYNYPFCYMLVENGNGNSMMLKNELWDNTTSQHQFKYSGVLTPGCSILLNPQAYCGQNYQTMQNNMYSLPLGKFPQLGYSCDNYTNWQTENALNHAQQNFMGWMNIIGGITSASSTSNVKSGTIQSDVANINTSVGGAFQIANVTYQKYLADRIPPQFSGTTSTGDINFSGNYNIYKFHYMTGKKEMLKICDDYLTMFGYQVNKLAIPNIKTRSNWNYIKCNGVNLHVLCSDEDSEEIKALFNRGITFWHNPSTFLDYSQNNN